MLKNWGTWLGLEKDSCITTQESNSTVDDNEDKTKEINKPSGADNEQTTATTGVTSPQLLQTAMGFGDYMYTFASSASKKLSESVVETAQTIKKSVEEGKIDGIINKTILGDFQKEQDQFVQEKNAKRIDAALPPWVGYNEEETIQQQILALSADKRNFLRDPPAGVQFHFDFEQMYPIAMVMLKEDELLSRMRFHLVPKQVKEEAFWKNYFYRVSLIKQSAQLTVLAAQQAAEKRAGDKNGCNSDDDHQAEIVRRKTPPAIISAKHRPNEDDEMISTSPGVSEFVSDAFDSSNINQEDLRKEMEQLVLVKKEHTNTQEEETPDWERELQQELQEYEVVADNENRDANWDKEIEEMLQEDS